MCAACGASQRALAAALRAFAPQQAIRPLSTGAVGSFADLLQRAVTPAVCAHLQREVRCLCRHAAALTMHRHKGRAGSPGTYAQGFAVVDGVLPPPLVAELGDELRTLHRAGALHLNATHLVTAAAGPGPSDGAGSPPAAPSAAKRTQLLHKSHIWEAELSLDAAVRQAAPAFAAVDADTTLMTLLNLFLPGLRLGSQATKLQLNEGAWRGTARSWVVACSCSRLLGRGMHVCHAVHARGQALALLPEAPSTVARLPSANALGPLTLWPGAGKAACPPPPPLLCRRVWRLLPAAHRL